MKVNKTHVDLGYFGTTNEKELKKKVTAFVKSNLVGKSINIGRRKIELTWQGLKNDINEYHRNYIEKLVSFAVLDKVLQKAVFLYEESDKRGNKNVKIFRYFGVIEVGSNEYDVIIIIKKTAKTFIYDHILIEKS